MRTLFSKLGGLALAAAGWLLVAAGARAAEPVMPPADPGFLHVHEWGTFLSVQGSDGVTLGGMVASEEILPPFVEARNLAAFLRTRSILFSKMETPVTYFYTDRPREVQVRVDMPKGILTHWFPLVREFGPLVAPNAPSGGSHLDWGRIFLVPDAAGPTASGAEQPVLRPLRPHDTWKFARQTDAALVKVHTRNPGTATGYDWEKFLFYRGLGTFVTPLEVRSSEEQSLKGGSARTLTLRNRDPNPLAGIFLIRVDATTIQMQPVANLSGGAIRHEQLLTTSIDPIPQRWPLEQGVPKVKEAVAAALVKAGLFPREAEAMVNTWEQGYFRTEGIRVLYLLPRPTVDALIPIKIQPAPERLVRVMVGRTEILTPEQERRIEKAVADLGSEQFSVRESASTALARLGRLGEPALRRVLAVTRDPEVRVRAEQLVRGFSATE